MSASNFSIRKIVNKAQHWHRHGKHRPILGWLIAHERERIEQPREPMFDSVREAFDQVRRKRSR